MWGGTVRRLLMAMMALAAWLGGAPATASEGIKLPVCVARVQARDTPAAMLRSDRFDCTASQASFGSGDFWAVSRPLALATVHRDLRIRTISLWQRRVTLYALYQDGKVAMMTTDQRATAPHLQLGAIIERQLPPHAAPLVRLLWKVEGAANVRAVVLGPEIVTAEQAAGANLQMAAIYAGFAGLALALLIHNFALWGALRHRFQLAYCAMVSGLLLYALSSSGTLGWLVPELANNDRIRINYLAMGMSALAAMAFARTFFEDRVVQGWLARVADVVAAALGASTLLFVALAPRQVVLLDRAYSISMLALLLVVVPLLWRAWRLRSRYLWIFVVAWAFPIVLAICRVLNNLNLLPWSFWLDQSTILSMTVEALVSSLAVAYRVRMLNQERDALRERELAARLLADTDPLTALANRRAFLRQAIGRSGDQVLMIIDIDHFKLVNETIGHDGGDEVLRVFARALAGAVPASALVARMGGEEFAVLASINDAPEAEPLLAQLRATPMPYDLTVTASIGACIGPVRTEPEWKRLYRIADLALYEAKAAGRDRSRSALAAAA